MIDNIWNNNRPYIIAEISQNHDGSLGQAHAFIDAVAQTGADAIKFQTHIADAESTPYEPFRTNFSYEDSTRFDYWKRMEFSPEQWGGLYKHAMEQNLDFLSSPFSIEALQLLDSIGVKAWKLGAGEVFNTPLLEAAIKTGKPILLSTGLSTWSEIDQQVNKVKAGGNSLLLFQCVTAYPSMPEMIDINQIVELKKRYNCCIGISDHSATIFPALAATTLGVNAIEVHVTLSKYMFGPDVKASVDLNQLSQIVEGSDFIFRMLRCHNDFSERDENRNELKKMFSKGIYALRNISKGELISENNIKFRKPNIGIDSTMFREVIGLKAKNSIKKDMPIYREDLF